jgi:hypothetical protein
MGNKAVKAGVAAATGGRLRAASATAQTAACANAQMGLLTRAHASSQRIEDATEIDMYIGLGTLVIIVLLIVLLR